MNFKKLIKYLWISFADPDAIQPFLLEYPDETFESDKFQNKIDIMFGFNSAVNFFFI